MKKSTALRLGLLASAVFFLFLFLQGVRFAPAGTVRIHSDHPSQMADARLDLNMADSLQLQSLHGIGQVLGDAIVTWREEHGPFVTVEDLLSVPGIGEKTLSEIREYVYINDGFGDAGAR